MTKKTLPLDTSVHRIIFLFGAFLLVFNFVYLLSAMAPKPQVTLVGDGFASAIMAVFAPIVLSLFGLAIGVVGLAMTSASMNKNKSLKQPPNKRAVWYIIFYLIVIAAPHIISFFGSQPY